MLTPALENLPGRCRIRLRSVDLLQHQPLFDFLECLLGYDLLSVLECVSGTTRSLSSSPMSESILDQLPPEPKLLWTPPHPELTRTHAFREKVNNVINKGANLKDYEDLYHWSVGEHSPSKEAVGSGADTTRMFWNAIWDESGIVGDKGLENGDTVCLLSFNFIHTTLTPIVRGLTQLRSRLRLSIHPSQCPPHHHGFPTPSSTGRRICSSPGPRKRSH